MENKIFTVAILGLGGRGADTYGKLINRDNKDKYKIVALCDLRQQKLDRFEKEFGVAHENCFLDEKEFFAKRRADLLIIATQDADHVRHALAAFEVGYDILLEKPLTANREECEKLLAAQKKSGSKALVCHVLRYAPAFVKVNELLESGVIGKLVAINSLERVAYWHQGHSYVRGNWRNSDTATPMILAKCCHDLDLLQYYAKSKCSTVSSVGELTYFKAENAPEGSADRCLNCKYVDECCYSAKRIYIGRWHDETNCNPDTWPFNILTDAPLTEEKLYAALKDGPYGRCVFHCDNNVVDHQIVTMAFENGVKAELTMTAFTKRAGRRMTFFGTLGEMTLDEADNVLTVEIFGGKTEVIDTTHLADNGYGHGGGDAVLIKTLYDMLTGNVSSVTSLEASVESHLMGICAEESRLNGGQVVKVHTK